MSISKIRRAAPNRSKDLKLDSLVSVD